LAKTVIVKIDGALAMALLPAPLHVDLSRSRSAASANNVALASEGEFKERFPDCQTGDMPPFGNLYGMPVFADESLARDKEIAFNAGSHRELVRIAWKDFVRLVEPKIIRFAAGSSHSAAA
jgi:Ala-tRNA(Pro) deacylase